MTFARQPRIHNLKTGRFATMFVAAVVAVSLALSGSVSATSGPQSKQDCYNKGYTHYGFKNQGQCVKAVVQAQHGNGYGGGNSNQGNTSSNIVISIKDATVGAINVTVNFVTNIFN